MRNVLILLIFITVVFSQIPTGAEYLIIGPDEYEDEMQPLIEWKMKKGILTRFVGLSETGEGYENIDAYIVTAHSTWTPTPRFLLLVGGKDDIEMTFAGTTSYGNYYSDWSYGNTDDDIYSELQTGRLPAQNAEELQIMVAKILEYEKNPLYGNWLSKGTCIVNEDGDDSDSIYYANCDSVMEDMFSAGYIHADMFNDGDGGHDDSDIIAAMDEGRGFIVYRGIGTSNWYPPFDINPAEANNSGKYPIIFSSTCNIVTTVGSPMIDIQLMRAGTVENPKGCVAYFGSTSSISSGAHLRGEVVEGFSHSFYSDTTNDISLACESGRRHTYSLYADTTQYKSHVLIGDPEMDIRTCPAKEMHVDHPLIAFVDESNDFNIQVTDAETGMPLSGALVCLYMEGEIYLADDTDGSGNASFTFNPDVEGYLDITVTHKNYFPYESLADIIIEGPNIYVSSFIIDDSSGGNGDGFLNPGEDAEITILLGNNGTGNAADVSAIISEDDPYVTVTSASVDYGSITIGEISTPSASFNVSINDVVPKHYDIAFDMEISDLAGNIWNRPEPVIPVISGDIQFAGYTAYDDAPYGNGDEAFARGETVKLLVEMENITNAQLSNVEINLIENLDPLYAEDALSVNYSWNGFEIYTTNSDPFWLTLSDASPVSDKAEITLLIEGEGLTYDFYDTLTFSVDLFGCQIGPSDNYGYYAYDDTDDETGRAPEFEWTDISSIGTNLNEISNADDRIVTYDIPFDFSFYGYTSDQISVCSNGFISIGVETWTGGSSDGHERRIPTVGAASSMIAGFWDDLNPSANGDVYGYHDAANNRYIIQYDGVSHFSRPAYRETFQIILLDQDYYYTPTDDGEIILMYDRVHYRYSNAVGIESPDETDGLQYLYHNDYMDNAALLTDERAIKFTTNPPLNPGPWLYIANYRIDDTEGGNGNMAIENGETIELYVTLRNSSENIATSTTTNLLCSESYISITDNSTFFGAMGSGIEYENSSDPYEFEVFGLTGNDFAQFELQISANSGSYTRSAPITLPVWNVLDVSETPKQQELELISCFPNPFNSSVTIVAHEDMQISILDINGRIISGDAAKSIRSGEIWQWQPEGALPSGIYLLKAIDEDSNIHFEKIILMK
ncbi:MAG: C25 family cysteine peptidase [Candidatus Zixiibacteriota bacterium]